MRRNYSIASSQSNRATLIFRNASGDDGQTNVNSPHVPLWASGSLCCLPCSDIV